MLFQFAIFLFALFALSRTYRQYRQEQVSRYWLIAFACLWGAVVIATLIPRLTDHVATFVGISRGADMLVYSSVIVLLYAVYRLLVKTQNMSQDITELVRALAITHVKVPRKDTDS